MYSKKLFRGTDTSFSIRGQQVILSQREEQAPSTPQQSRTVSGTVTDQLGEPLIGATVREQGTNNAVTTDFDGKFFLDVTSANPTLEINTSASSRSSKKWPRAPRWKSSCRKTTTRSTNWSWWATAT